MNNYFLLILNLNILNIHCNKKIEIEKFSGCQKIFENNLNFFKINFKEACINLLHCSQNIKFRKEDCLEQFEIDQKRFCRSKFGHKIYVKKYCEKMILDNLNKFEDLDEEYFKGEFVAFIK